MKKPRQTWGFTLLEIMIVVAVIGLLSALAIPAVSKARTTAQLNGCLENQRLLFQFSALYELEQGTNLNSIASSGVAIRNAIISAGYVTKSNAFDCPASPALDYDDYQLRYSGTTLTGTYCSIVSTHISP